MVKSVRTAVYGPVRTVVWEGGGRETAPYPDYSGRSRRFRSDRCSPTDVT
jgi:hypothetical protein